MIGKIDGVVDLPGDWEISHQCIMGTLIEQAKHTETKTLGTSGTSNARPRSSEIQGKKKKKTNCIKIFVTNSFGISDNIFLNQ